MSHGHGSPPPPQAVMQMMMGMWVSQILGVTAKLGIADLIAAGTTSSDAIADQLGASHDGVYRLLRGAAAIGLLVKTGSKTFANTPLSECIREAPGSMRAFAISETDPSHWLPWGRFEDAVRTGAPTTQATLGMQVWEWYAQHPAEAQWFSRSMGGLSAMAGGAVLAKFDVKPYAHIVDVGGAFGDWLAQMLSVNTTARGTLFDLPHNSDGAKQALAAKGLAARVEFVGGSFLEAVPTGGDLYLLKHILHDWSDAECKTILERVRRAMGPRGQLLVADFVIPEENTPSPAPLIDLNMMVMLTGRERTVSEFAALFASAGLKLERVIATDAPVFGLLAVPA